MDEDLDVLAFPVRPELNRRDVKDLVIQLLDEHQLLSKSSPQGGGPSSDSRPTKLRDFCEAVVAAVLSRTTEA